MNIWTFLIVAGSVWALFQILAVVIGWRFTKLRATAVVEWQDCDQQERTEWDYSDVEAIATLVRESTTSDADPDADESDDLAEHFQLWQAEVSGVRAVRRGLKKMEKLP